MWTNISEVAHDIFTVYWLGLGSFWNILNNVVKKTKKTSHMQQESSVQFLNL
jgi:hypothetical protein